MFSFDFFGRLKKQHSITLLDRKLVASQLPSKFPSLKQLKYMKHVLSRWEMLIASGALVVFLCSGLYIAWNLFSLGLKEVPQKGGTYTEGLIGSPQYINPLFLQHNDVDRDLVSLVYSGMIRFSKDRKIIPDLATRYEISPDGKVYTFTLRKDVVWHDGKPFSARDVVFTLEKIKDPHVKSPSLISFKDVKVEQIGDDTVRLILDKPFVPFLDLATLPIIPEHIWNTVSSESFHLAAYNLKPIGTGPWKFQSLKRDKDGAILSYTLSHNDEYYQEKAYVDKLHFKFYPDNDSAIQSLKNGQVDGVSFLPRSLRDRLKKQSNVSYYTFNLPQYTSLFFNQQKNQFLSDISLRRALAYAIDKETMVREVLAGEGVVIHAPLLEHYIGYHKDIRTYPFDPAQAVLELEKGGWKRNTEMKWEKNNSATGNQKQVTSKKNNQDKETDVLKNKKGLTITLTTVQNPEGVALAEQIKKNWNAIGIDVDIVLSDPSRVKQEIIDPRNYEVFLYGEIIGSDPDLYPFWHSSQILSPGLNLSLFSSKTADKLLEEGRRTSDDQERARVYRKFQELLIEELPAIFLFNPSYNYVVSKRIRGIEDNKQIIYPSDRFIDSVHWYIKTKRIWKTS